MNVWIASIFWQFQLTMLRLWVCKYFFETLLAVLEGGTFLEIELLERVVILLLFLRKCCIFFFLSSSTFVVCFDQKDFCSCSLYVIFYIKEPYLSHVCEVSRFCLISFCCIILMLALFRVKCIVGTLHHDACEI